VRQNLAGLAGFERKQRRFRRSRRHSSSFGSRSAVVAVACVLVVLFAGCGGGGGSPTGVARSYEKAIMSRDGHTLCATFAPKMREVIGEQITLEQSAAGSTGFHFDCGAFYHVLIGYSHENTDKRFVAGRLLSVGSPRQVRRDGVLYVKVPAKLRLDYVYTGSSAPTGTDQVPNQPHGDYLLIRQSDGHAVTPPSG
jgi:hypothetical protein